MKTIVFTLFALYSMISLGQNRNTAICVTGDDMDERDIELSIGYYQMDHGYLFLDATTSFDIVYGIGFYEQGIKSGYNPWENCVLVQTTQSLGIGIFNYDLYTGWAQNLTIQKGLFFLAPGISASFKYFDVGYSYSFDFNRSMVGFHSGSNLNIKIPIRSTCGFQQFREHKTWHWGETHKGPLWY